MRRIAIAIALTALATGTAWPQTPERPVRLVLQITVDQLRGDLIERYSAGYGKGGFQRLLDDGAFYVGAHHRHANTETVVGHATLATGTDPAVHGMNANVWLDRATEQLVYNVEDADNQKWEVDFPGYGQTFPHPYGTADGKYFTTLLTISPAGDEIVLDFAKDLIVAEKLGQDGATDYLSTSFSSTDYVGHFFQPYLYLNREAIAARAAG